jgi:hypothetical protein
LIAEFHQNRLQNLQQNMPRLFTEDSEMPRT